MKTISDLVILRDQFTASAVWLENYETGRHREFPAIMSDEEIRAEILGRERERVDEVDKVDTVDERASQSSVVKETVQANDEEENEQKRKSRREVRQDKRKLRAQYLRELKKCGHDLSAERSFSKIEAAYQEYCGKEKR